MKTTLHLIILFSAITGLAQTQTHQSMSPAEQSIAVARKLIEKNPKNFEAYNALALALSRRARETSDVFTTTRPRTRSKNPSKVRRTTSTARERRFGCCSANTSSAQPSKRPKS